MHMIVNQHITADFLLLQHGSQQPGEMTMTPGGRRTPIISISDTPVYHEAHGDAGAADAAAHVHEQQAWLRPTDIGPGAALESLRRDSMLLQTMGHKRNGGLTKLIMLTSAARARSSRVHPCAKSEPWHLMFSTGLICLMCSTCSTRAARAAGGSCHRRSARGRGAAAARWRRAASGPCRCGCCYSCSLCGLHDAHAYPAGTHIARNVHMASKQAQHTTWIPVCSWRRVYVFSFEHLRHASGASRWWVAK